MKQKAFNSFFSHDNYALCKICQRYPTATTKFYSFQEGRDNILIVTAEQDPTPIKELKQLCTSLQIDPTIINLTRCSGDKPPKKREIELCSTFTQKYFDNPDLRKVLLMGATSIKYVLGVKNSNSVLSVPHRKNGKLYLPTHSPQSLSRKFQGSAADARIIMDLLYLVQADPNEESKTYKHKRCLITNDNLDLQPGNDLLNNAKYKGPISVDVETKNLDNPYLGLNQLYSISFTREQKDGTLVSVAYALWYKTTVPEQSIINSVKSILTSDIPKIGHNYKFDERAIRALLQVKTKNFIWDTLVAYKSMDENGLASLKILVPRHLGIKQWGTYQQSTLEDLLKYNAADTEVTLLLYKWEKDKVPAVYPNFIHKALLLLIDIEQNGVHVDRSILRNMLSAYKQKEQQLHTKLLQLYPVNPNSPDQIASQVFNTETTDEKTLKALSCLQNKQGNYAKVLLEYRKITKIKSTYLEPYEKITSKVSFIHPTFNINGTVTGRLSSSNPNIQNVPKEPRPIFTSRFEEGLIISADFSQLEFRLFGEYSKDKTILQAINDGVDLHTATAVAIFNTPTPTKEQRKIAKTINFGLGYGMGVKKLARTLNLSLKEASTLKKKFTAKFQTYMNWRKQLANYAIEHGYVEARNGRRRHFPTYVLAQHNGRIRAQIQRLAVNSPVQSLASDLCLLSAIIINNTIKESNLKATIIALVHDSITIDCPKEEASLVTMILKNTMSRIDKLSGWITTKMDVDIKVSTYWEK